jgi:hypothetical protein
MNNEPCMGFSPDTSFMNGSKINPVDVIFEELCLAFLSSQ